MTGLSGRAGDLVFFVLASAYFVFWALTQMTMGGVAALLLWRHTRRTNRRALALIDGIASPTVSVIVPAYNEQLTIVQSLRALLALDYDAFEIVVVNDGSKDDTLAELQRTFSLLPAPLAFEQPLPSAPVRGVYRSMSEPSLVVIDKENGGCKADASNAGINAATGTLVLVIDADTVLAPDALRRSVLPFLEDPRTIACGATVGVANGCRIKDGRVVDVGLPTNWLPRFQVIEYLRAFLMFRLACTSRNALLLLSGAFGLFRRDAVVAVGGFDATAIGEDFDLTVRLQKWYRERGEPFRIAFDPTPLSWTQAPEDWASLRSQRWRWRRGLLQTLWRHREMIGNLRYGIAGLGTLLYISIFEGIGPLFETASLLVAIVGAALGILTWSHLAIVISVWALLGVAVTLTAVLLSDLSTRLYMRGSATVVLMAAALLENFGYRQLNSFWSCVGTVQAMTGRGGWGTMKRKAFES